MPRMRRSQQSFNYANVNLYPVFVVRILQFTGGKQRNNYLFKSERINNGN